MGRLFSDLEQAEASLEDSIPRYSCACTQCGDGPQDPGAGGGFSGDFATSPGDNAWRYVAQSSGRGTDAAVDTLVAGSKWTSLDGAGARTVVTYSFANPATSVYQYNYANIADFASTLRGFSEADKQLTRTVLQKIAAVCNLEFVEVADNASQCGVLRYGYSQAPEAMHYAGYAFYPSTSAIGGDIWIATSQAEAKWDFYRPNLLLHETLHALGLKHPFSGGAVLPSEQDIIPNTVMSYSAVIGARTGTMSHFPSEPMAYDIAALQHLYGASSLNAEDTRYDLASSEFQSGFRTLWDAAGTDTLDASRLTRGVSLDLSAGASSEVGASVRAQGWRSDGSAVQTTYSGTLTIAANAQIENAVGTAFADRIAGNALANALHGGAGRDWLEGRGGDDYLDGGSGIDTAVFAGSRAAFQITRSANGFIAQDLTGAEGKNTLLNIERLQFADTSIALDLYGNAGVVATLLGAVFGAAAVNNREYAGIGLSLADSGMSPTALAQLALNTRLGTNASSVQVVDLLYSNVMGRAPDAAALGHYSGMLDSGSVSGASLALVAAGTAENHEQIGFTGLAAVGMPYLV